MKPIPIEHLALSFIEHIGNTRIKKLVTHLGAPEAVFQEKISSIRKIPGFKNLAKEKWNPHQAIEAAKKEMEFVQKNKIGAYSYWSDSYPIRLKHCLDSPVILYTHGKFDFNRTIVLSIVGTRNATEYGIKFTEQLVKALEGYPALIVSGLAYGIDITAHKACVRNNITTLGVLAHGLDRIYPPSHKNTVKKMLKNGGVITEFPSNTNPDRENFPRRNRIVAGIADATIVIESDIKGGSMITAEIANAYNRDVFALPGDVDKISSRGCNFLIRNNQASLIESPAELLKIMGWEKITKPQPTVIQTTFFPDLSEEESEIVAILQEKGKSGIDVLSLQTRNPVSKLAALLLSLEFKGILKSLPGKQYQLLTK